MSRLLATPLALFLSLSWLAAFAADAADAPAETASPLVVIGFLVVLVGSCLGYVGYMAWAQKRTGGKEE
jgi:hypothetical protein